MYTLKLYSTLINSNIIIIIIILRTVALETAVTIILYKIVFQVLNVNRTFRFQFQLIMKIYIRFDSLGRTDFLQTYSVARVAVRCCTTRSNPIHNIRKHTYRLSVYTCVPYTQWYNFLIRMLKYSVCARPTSSLNLYSVAFISWPVLRFTGFLIRNARIT